MRLHSIRFAAIGPFAGEHVIDFDALGDSALFLIDGPTGAGKSTIIDALVFALYGDVAGHTDKERLRSAFADSGDESYAEVDLSVSGGRIKVRRTPAFERSKKRGAGTTSVASSVQLWRSVGAQSWEPVSASKGEADDEIAKAVGLNRAQFVQTVVLPQGEFATFLRADSGDRLPMLERIFATDVYRRVQDHLDDARRDAERRIGLAQSAVGDAMQRVIGVLAGTESEALVREAVEQEDLTEQVWRTLIEALLADIEATASAYDALQADADTAVDAAQARLTAATSAKERHQAVRRAVEAEDAAQRALDAAVAELELPPGVKFADLRDAVQAQLDALAPLAVVEHDLPREREAIARDRSRIEEIAALRDALVHDRDLVLPAAIAGRALTLQARREAAQRALEGAERVLSSLRERRLHGMAGELASALAPGLPCPVCGALEHPSPTQSPPDRVSPDDITDQESRVSAERAEVEAQAQAEARASAALAMGAAATDLRQSEASSEELLAEIDELVGRQRQADTQLAEMASEEHLLVDRIATTVSVLDEHERLLVVASAEFATVQERIDDLTRQRANADRALAASTRLEATQQALEEAQELVGADEAPSAEVLEQVNASLRDARAHASAVKAESVRLAALVERLRDSDAQVLGAYDELAEIRRGTATLLRVARAMTGSGGGLSLATFAVQQVFDEVVAAANTRLRAMLDGRFQLVATAERTGAKRIDQGLGLKVRDLATETERRTATLSGGESFCASLALALGLADTVRAHAGGIEIDTLFVDEGFGSLDTERLGDVMDELLRLRADGRSVGVISHVTEMKHSIHERIDVIPRSDGQGSTLRVNWMGA